MQFLDFSFATQSQDIKNMSKLRWFLKQKVKGVCETLQWLVLRHRIGILVNVL